MLKRRPEKNGRHHHPPILLVPTAIADSRLYSINEMINKISFENNFISWSQSLIEKRLGVLIDILDL